MKKRLLGPIAVCVTAAGLSLAQAEPPARLFLGGYPPPAASPSGPPAAMLATVQQPAPANQNPPGGTPTPGPGGTSPAEAPVPPNGSASGGETVNAAAPVGSGGGQRPKVDLRDNHIGPIDRVWVRGEYLYWWIRNGPIAAPLLVGGDGSVVLGGSSLDYHGESGGRLTGGIWLDDLHQLGIEVSAFAVNQYSKSEAVSSDANGNPPLGRPIQAAPILGANPTPFTVPITAPGVLAGGLSLSSTSRLWGAETNFVRNLWDDLHFSGSLLFGVRYLSLEENLQINQTTMAIPGGDLSTLLTPFGTLVTPGTVVDSFRTQNYFYGGQIGGRVGWRGGIWAVDLETKLALGTNHEAVNILGSNTPGGGTQSSGGFLALATNSGHQAANWFVVVPEVGLQVGCQLGRHWRAQVDYDFLYINSVVRPGNQVNNIINPGFLPPAPAVPAGPPRPESLLRQSDFWAHGITAGVTFTY